MIEFNKVTKSFGGRIAVSDVSLSLPPHQIHVLIGESGSGKSTLIRLATGLIRSDSGEIRLEGTMVSKIRDSERAKIFGYMVQSGGLFPHLKCIDNVLLPTKIHYVDNAKDRMVSLWRLVGLDESLLKRFPKQLSGGQQQRVALVRSLILDPPILFLDEPMGALDPIVRSELQLELKSIFKDLKKTVVIVTHDLAEAAFFGDTITLLKSGRIEQTGSVDDVLSQPQTNYVRKYFKAQRPPPKLSEYSRNFGES